MLAYEAKRRPKLALMMQHLECYSGDEIMQQTEFPKWLRQALRMSKKQRVGDALQAANSGLIVDGVMPDPLGEMRRWVASSQFIPLHHGQSLQIDEGSLLWLPLSGGGLWIETIFCRHIAPQIIANSRAEQIIAKSGYIAAYKKIVAALIPADTGLVATRQIGRGTAGLTYQIYRI